MSTINWRKSSRSGAGNDCVELASDLAGVRDSKNLSRLPGRPIVPSLVAWLRLR